MRVMMMMIDPCVSVFVKHRPRNSFISFSCKGWVKPPAGRGPLAHTVTAEGTGRDRGHGTASRSSSVVTQTASTQVLSGASSPSVGARTRGTNCVQEVRAPLFPARSWVGMNLTTIGQQVPTQARKMTFQQTLLSSIP